MKGSHIPGRMGTRLPIFARKTIEMGQGLEFVGQRSKPSCKYSSHNLRLSERFHVVKPSLELPHFMPLLSSRGQCQHSKLFVCPTGLMLIPSYLS